MYKRPEKLTIFTTHAATISQIMKAGVDLNMKKSADSSFEKVSDTLKNLKISKEIINQLLHLCTVRTAWSDSVIMSASVRFGNLAYFGPFSVNVLPNADQWKPDDRVVTNEKPRN